jgi:NAD(P)H-nitrite reductase large subunit
MSAAQFAIMGHHMARMMEEMADFDEDDEQNTVAGQSLSANFNRLAIEDGVSSESPRSTFIHGSSSTYENHRHVIISGDHTEVDNNLYQFNFDSHKVENNLIKNSFGEGDQEKDGVWRMLGIYVHLCFLNKLFIL